MQQSTKNTLVITLLIVLSVFFFRKSINEFPSHIHAWSQSDRYALALGFVNNDLDFFHPQTYNLNVQFPAKHPISMEGVTAVDFPIHEYVIAIIMKATHCTQPFVFRLYSLLYSCIGLFFLFKICELFNDENFWLNLLVVAFVFTAPVYTYYMFGFIPSTTSFANLFMGFYFYYRYQKQNQIKDFYRSIFFIAIAALSRTPFAIFLIAVSIQQLLDYNKEKFRQRFIALALSFLTIAAYFFYNSYLRSNYGSIFLSNLMMPNSWLHFKEVLHVVYDRWFFQYFTSSHYLMLIAIVLAAIFSITKLKAPINSLQKKLIIQIVISSLGVLFYFLLMAIQFKEHDYYFIDTFLVIAVLLVVFFVSVLPKIKNLLLIIPVSIALIFMVMQDVTVQAKRNDTGSWDRYQATINNFTDADVFLTENKVPDSARILVIDAYSPNIPFILMKRKGFSVITTSKAEIDKALKLPFDYVVLQNEFILSDVLNNYPDLKDYLTPLNSNGKITLYQYKKTKEEKTLSSFLGFDKRTALVNEHLNFDTIINSKVWAAADKLKKDNVYAGGEKYFSFMDSTIQYSATFQMPANGLDTSKTHTFIFEGDFYGLNNLAEVFVSCYAGHADVVNYQQYFDVSTSVRENESWQHVSFLFQVNKINTADELKVFIWNPKQKNFYYNNLSVKVY
jgi:hypothetical protein